MLVRLALALALGVLWPDAAVLTGTGAATLAAQGSLAPGVAGTGAVLASFTSMAFSLSFVLGLLLARQLEPWFAQRLPALGRLHS